MNSAGFENEPLWRQALRKILTLEESKGFADTAVSGGIRRFVDRWESELRGFLGDDAGKTAYLVDTLYRDLTPDERRAWVAHWQKVLANSPTSPLASTARLDGMAPDASGVTNAAVVRTLFPTEDARPLGRVHRANYGRPVPAASPGNPDELVSKIRRMDQKTVGRLELLGVGTVRDLLYMLPRRHVDRSEITSIADVYPGGTFTLDGTLVNISPARVGPRNLQLAQGTLRDETGTIDLQWFGQGFLARSLRAGSHMTVTGKVETYRNRPVMPSPEYDVVTERQPPVNTARITPVYRLTQGMTARNLRSLTWQAIVQYVNGLEDSLTEDVRRRTGLVPLRNAITDLHYPADLVAAEAGRRRLAFDEILGFQLAVIGRRRHREENAVDVPVKYDQATVDGFLAGLPFSPTRAQERCVAEILSDMARGTPPMSRLLQGEVGSGKTLVALAAVLAVASAHRQSALMAPTEVLAEQHFRTVNELLQGFDQPMQQDNVLSVYLPQMSGPFTVGLLTGSTRARARREVLRMVAEGNMDLLIGTQALIQDGVDIPNLALAVMDEQHRFGVEQRSALRSQGTEQPHSLMMSATPIPRTLQLTLYGDLDVSTIDELPPGRQEILTRIVPEDKRTAAYGFVRQQINAGRQAFIICPLVEESDRLDVRAAVEEHKRLSTEVFPDLKLGLMHGRLSSRDKDKSMRQFRDGELDILVATAVVEVGIDVPNAAVMLIDGADRFGLAQLHQFRGRVGRGQHKSYCLLMSESESERARERLTALESTGDGFKLAEIDLQMRHEGDIFGTSQSGDQTVLRIANLFDQDLMALARQEALAIMDADPRLTDPTHAGLVAERDRFLTRFQQHLDD